MNLTRFVPETPHRGDWMKKSIANQNAPDSVLFKKKKKQNKIAQKKKKKNQQNSQGESH